jgi:hypothetical protein
MESDQTTLLLIYTDQHRVVRYTDIESHSSCIMPYQACMYIPTSARDEGHVTAEMRSFAGPDQNTLSVVYNNRHRVEEVFCCDASSDCRQ